MAGLVRKRRYLLDPVARALRHPIYPIWETAHHEDPPSWKNHARNRLLHWKPTRQKILGTAVGFNQRLASGFQKHHPHHLHPLVRRGPHPIAPQLRKRSRNEQGTLFHDLARTGTGRARQETDQWRHRARQLGLASELPSIQKLYALAGGQLGKQYLRKGIGHSLGLPTLFDLHARRVLPRRCLAKWNQTHDWTPKVPISTFLIIFIYFYLFFRGIKANLKRSFLDINDEFLDSSKKGKLFH